MTTETATTDCKIVTFILGNQTFGIDMTALIEIREWENPTPLPNVPSFIKGVTNLRGNVIPVVGLPVGGVAGVYAAERRRLGNSPDAWRSTWITIRAIGLGVLIELAAGVVAVAIWATAVVIN